MIDKVTARLQTPEDSTGARKDIHLISTTDEVVVNPTSETPKNLTTELTEIHEKIGEVRSCVGIVISNTQPTTQNQVIWVKPITE